MPMPEIIDRLHQVYVRKRLRSRRCAPTQSFGVVAYAPHRTASMFIFKLFRDLSMDRGVSFFSANNSPPNHDQLTSDINSSFCVAPVRSFTFRTHFENIGQIKNVVQIRDPRDIVVSEYFSLAYSHPDKSWPAEQKLARDTVRSMTVDEYALSVIEDNNPALRLSKYSLKHRLLELLPAIAADATIVRYEDMVRNYGQWLTAVIGVFEFGECSSSVHRRYYRKYNHVFRPPETEDIYAHKRSILPGNHRIHLSRESVEALNEQFAGFLARYGYQS